ncbi:MAG: pyridoxal-dependent decarboxylase [Methylococcales bacterium]|nr:pyridoxal-dependent decarboxylase [Methylococcales bacterium]
MDHFHAYQAILSRFNEELSIKLGYPGSLLSTLHGVLNPEQIEITASGQKIINNEVIGIMPNSLAEIHINNIGSPWKNSESYTIEIKDIEIEAIEILGHYFGLPKEVARGYITTGGTEANLACLWWSKLWLARQQKKQSSPPFPKVFCSQDTHYSIHKISHLMGFELGLIESDLTGEINLIDLECKLTHHIENNPKQSIIMVANIGTTVTGAMDDVLGIKHIFETITLSGKRLPYTIHADAACYGMIIPVTKPFHQVTNYFTDLGVNTMTLSGHKFLGTNILGIPLTTEPFLREAFEKNTRIISYCGNIDDITISGSRSGINILWLHNTLKQLRMDHSFELIEKMVAHNLENAQFLYNQLVALVGDEHVIWIKGQFNVVFPRPSVGLIKKFKLMPANDNKAVICTHINVSRDLLDEFINEYRQERAE